MFNAIGEATMQQYVRTNYNAEIFDKNHEAQKAEKINAQRPVEKSEDGQKSELSWQSNETIQSRNSLEEGRIIVEKYDSDGKLVKKIPPGYLPFGEFV